MITKNKGTLYIFIIVISLVLVLAYLYLRTTQVNSINTQVARLKAETARAAGEKSAREKQEKVFPEKAGLAAFAEELFEAARLSGLKKHEVTTVKTGDLPERKNIMKAGAAESVKALKTHALKISIEGDYRNTAEYLREMQNLRRYYIRIMELVMRPADKAMKTDLTVEVVSEDGKDAAQ